MENGGQRTSTVPFIADRSWRPELPRALVVACSDGRFQEALDEFLHSRLGLRDYDRLYVAGGPGAMAPGQAEAVRGDLLWKEAAFLIEAHDVQELILVFHGASPGDGPVDARCADYRRRMAGAGTQEVHAQQERDLAEVVKLAMAAKPELTVRAYRAEAGRAQQVQFVALRSTASEL